MLQFAVPGSPRSTPGSGGTIAGLKRTAELGLTAMEVEWVQRVPSNTEHIEHIGKVAHDLGITLTVHAPYFVNLNSREPEKLLASKKRVLHALTMAEIMGAVSVCVHPAFYLTHDQKDTYEHVRRATQSILKQKKQFFPNVNLAFETMGKHSQFGTLEEVLTLSQEFDIYPCIDPAHLHARSNGALNSVREWNTMFDQYTQALGKKSLKNMHLHFSGIAYGPKGEKHHLPLQNSDAKWKDFIAVLAEKKVGGVCVCESPLMEDDTLLMQKQYDIFN
ncbi:hypothetical protein COU77_01285 [Candidatus Peregrinibacteria bacterium CG10_big_fil_rev_8_21_14_0_10_49_16]|nr:MAG: hypothetical protein COW95_01115 [Candidatus Peregrinibacteria bacterium CG22_combo_CG10-13_8_21_14_all_49_11]PIR52272.1 MAG: hypothetical protein COU77_01285 [Candidatus Peregrinibacteria bacterium CG10_big_fil_rev_8_21_14_0_10_49_16]